MVRCSGPEGHAGAREHPGLLDDRSPSLCFKVTWGLSGRAKKYKPLKVCEID